MHAEPWRTQKSCTFIICPFLQQFCKWILLLRSCARSSFRDLSRKPRKSITPYISYAFLTPSCASITSGQWRHNRGVWHTEQHLLWSTSALFLDCLQHRALLLTFIYIHFGLFSLFFHWKPLETTFYNFKLYIFHVPMQWRLSLCFSWCMRMLSQEASGGGNHSHLGMKARSASPGPTGKALYP